MSDAGPGARFDATRSMGPLEALEHLTRPLDDPGAIVREAMELLRQRLAADRCAWAEIEDDENHFAFLGDARAPHVPAVSGRYPVSAFGDTSLRTLRAGQPFVVSDALAAFAHSDEVSGYHATGIRALIAVPVHIDGRFAAGVGVHMLRAREWTADEVALAVEVTRHCWHLLRRARVLSSLRAREARLLASEAELRAVANLAPAMVWACRPSGEVVFMSDRWAQYTGQPVEAALGAPWTSAVHPDEVPAVLARWHDSQAAGTPFEAELRYRRHDAAYRWHTVRATPHRDQGVVTKWFGLSVDVHDARTAHQEMRDSEQRLHHFIAVLAHELRNPLAPIRTATALLQRLPELPPASVRFHAVIERQAEQLTRLLDELLDITRVSSGRITLQHDAVRLADVVASAVEAVGPQLKAHHLEVTDTPGTPLVLGDAVRLCQILTNLLHNAAKFTPPGGHIRVAVSPATPGARVQVSDDGAGMTGAAMARAFRLFAHAGHAGHTSGFGIGLWLARHLAELHGGTLIGESAGEGRGCTFTLTLPAVTTAPLSHAEAPRVDGPLVRRVLVVDDNRDAADTTAALLEAMGCDVAVAYGGQQALDHVAADPPELVLLDLGMSPIDGYDVCRVLRARHPAVRVVALTGWGDVVARQRAAAAGFAEHLVKPVTPEVLREAVRRVPVA